MRSEVMEVIEELALLFFRFTVQIQPTEFITRSQTALQMLVFVYFTIIDMVMNQKQHLSALRRLILAFQEQH